MAEQSSEFLLKLSSSNFELAELRELFSAQLRRLPEIFTESLQMIRGFTVILHKTPLTFLKAQD